MARTRSSRGLALEAGTEGNDTRKWKLSLLTNPGIISDSRTGDAPRQKVCPRCGAPRSGPHLKRIRESHFGLYFEHRRSAKGISQKSGTTSRREVP
jgi:hypothetical protein